MEDAETQRRRGWDEKGEAPSASDSKQGGCAALLLALCVGPEASPVGVTDADGEKQGSEGNSSGKKEASPSHGMPIRLPGKAGSMAQERGLAA